MIIQDKNNTITDIYFGSSGKAIPIMIGKKEYNNRAIYPMIDMIALGYREGTRAKTYTKYAFEEIKPTTVEPTTLKRITLQSSVTYSHMIVVYKKVRID